MRGSFIRLPRKTYYKLAGGKRKGEVGISGDSGGGEKRESWSMESRGGDKTGRVVLPLIASIKGNETRERGIKGWWGGEGRGKEKREKT